MENEYVYLLEVGDDWEADSVIAVYSTHAKCINGMYDFMTREILEKEPGRYVGEKTPIDILVELAIVTSYHDYILIRRMKLDDLGSIQWSRV